MAKESELILNPQQHKWMLIPRQLAIYPMVAGTPTPDEHQEAGQLEAEAEVEAGMIDGETDAEGDIDDIVG